MKTTEIILLGVTTATLIILVSFVNKVSKISDQIENTIEEAQKDIKTVKDFINNLHF